MRGEPAQDSVDHAVGRLAARQHGVITRRQLRALGFGDDAIDGRVRAGRLHRVHRGVYALLPPPLGEAGDAMAATLACGDQAVLSHRSAAALWRLQPESTGATDIMVPTRAGRTHRAGIRIHRCALTAREITRRRGIPVTTVARTLLDLAAILTPDDLERAVDRAEHLRLLDPRATEALLAAHPHRHGAPGLRRSIRAHATGPVLRSELERAFLALCAEYDLPTPRTNRRLGPHEADFHWPEQRLIVETDGREHHARRRDFARDRARDAENLVRGWRTVRFTYGQVAYEARWVAGIVGALTRAGRA